MFHELRGEAASLLNIANECFHESYSQMPNIVFVWQETAVHRPSAMVDFPTWMLNNDDENAEDKDEDKHNSSPSLLHNMVMEY